MPYCARFRFKLLPQLQLDASTTAVLNVPGFPSAELKIANDASLHGHWAIITIRGFKTKHEAVVAGQKLGDTLSLMGALTRIGIDTGFSRSTLQFSREVHAALEATTGETLRSETHGLMVFEENATRIVGMSATGSLLLNPAVFEEHLVKYAGSVGSLTERQKNCAALLNDSFFVVHAESQFILRVSAVEALCDQTDVGVEYQSAISDIETFVAGQAYPSDLRKTLENSLKFQKKQSLRQSYLAKFKTLLSDKEAKAFDTLYKKRSTLVHDGIGRGSFDSASNDVLDLAVPLLAADVARSNP